MRTQEPSESQRRMPLLPPGQIHLLTVVNGRRGSAASRTVGVHVVRTVTTGPAGGGRLVRRVGSSTYVTVCFRA